MKKLKIGIAGYGQMGTGEESLSILDGLSLQYENKYM